MDLSSSWTTWILTSENDLQKEFVFDDEKLVEVSQEREKLRPREDREPG